MAAVLVLAAYLYFRTGPGPGRLSLAKKDYNLILISIDTVRDDALGLYNPKGAPTPALDRIAGNSYTFTDVISQVPFTLPSHCTMLTGTYPMKHLVQENTRSSLPDSALTLAEVLKQKGYVTAGFIGSIVLGSTVGIGQGFDTYEDLFTLSDVKFADLGGIQKSAAEVYTSFRTWFDKKPPGKFFAFIHFYDAHAPYEPPDPYIPEIVTPMSMYQGELRYVDSVIGRLFDEMNEKKVWEDTVLIITGDHGEMLGEHREMGHGYYIYQQALRVPLIVVIPGKKGKTSIEKPVQIVDVMPTILDILQIGIPKTVQGVSTTPLFDGTPTGPRFAYSESLSGTQTFGTAPLRSIQDATYKYIDTARPELYDIRTDKLEEKNLYDQKKDLAGKMKSALQNVMARYSADVKETAAERKLSAEESEQFAALGYISGSAANPEVNLTKDPKDYIEYWTDTSKLNSFLKDGKFQECLDLTGRMRAADALPVTAQIFEARCYHGVGDSRKSIAILEDVLKKDPENSQAISAAADAYVRVGQPEKAIALYKQLVEKQRSMLALQNYARHMMALGKKQEVLDYVEKMQKEGKLTEKEDEVVGEIYVNLGENQKARPFLTRAVENHPDGYKAYALLASVMDSQGETSPALALLEGAKDRFDQVEFLLQLGVLYHKTHQPDRELETFRKMVQTHPKDARGFFYLGKVLMDRGGNFEKVLELAKRGLELKPVPEYQIFGNYLMADAYTNLGMDARAQSFYAKAKEISATEKKQVEN